MIGDPPFGGDDAEALTVSEQMFGFQGQLYKFPPRIRKPQIGDFPDSFVRGRRQRSQRGQRRQRGGFMGLDRFEFGTRVRKIEGRGGALTCLGGE